MWPVKTWKHYLSSILDIVRDVVLEELSFDKMDLESQRTRLKKDGQGDWKLGGITQWKRHQNLVAVGERGTTADTEVSGLNETDGETLQERSVLRSGNLWV
jgi:hypothetical protein